MMSKEGTTGSSIWKYGISGYVGDGGGGGCIKRNSCCFYFGVVSGLNKMKIIYERDRGQQKEIGI